MKVVIFAGGLGTRLSEETTIKPKPMVEIGGKPILWHIMKIYAHYGFNDFVICLGYKGYLIKEYFLNYFLYNSDVEIDLVGNSMKVLNSKSEQFKVTLIDTGEETKTAGRLKRVQPFLEQQDFMLTYGDGVGDIRIDELIKFHKAHGKLATVTSIPLEARFGGMDLLDDGIVSAFREKAKDESKWINGGFFVLKPDVFNYLQGDVDQMMWEDDPLEKLAKDRQLMAFRHRGFWKPMDALRDKIELDQLWKSGEAKWKIWH